VVADEDVGAGLEDWVEVEGVEDEGGVVDAKGVGDEVIEARVDLDEVRAVLEDDCQMEQSVSVLYF
jgi:hypothetical protein